VVLSLGYSERKKLKEMLLESEANIPWMYCDSRGNVTVGIGHLIPNAEAATKLPF